MVANVKECCVREQPKASLNKYVYKSMNVKSFIADRQILYQIHQTQKEAEPIVAAVDTVDRAGRLLAVRRGVLVRLLARGSALAIQGRVRFRSTSVWNAA